MKDYRWPIVVIVGLTLAAITIILISTSNAVEHITLLVAFVGSAFALFAKNSGTNGTP